MTVVPDSEIKNLKQFEADRSLRPNSLEKVSILAGILLFYLALALK